uniref:Uncharacterized protein n=1 Tax=Setaria italica TaxID=4555 RepID=K3Y4D4_SETIT
MEWMKVRAGERRRRAFKILNPVRPLLPAQHCLCHNFNI